MGRKRIMSTSELTLKVAICGMNQNKIVQLGAKEISGENWKSNDHGRNIQYLRHLMNQHE
jgi:hypothetical protein